MLLTSSFLLLAAGIGYSNAQACNADNCARAVTGTANGLQVQASRRADCSSFFVVTVTPEASTSTVFTTVTSTTLTSTASTETDFVVVTATETDTSFTTRTTNTAGDTVVNQKRQVTVKPSAVPSYASACSGTVRYSSACSCFGVIQSTITAPAPVATTTVIVSATPTATVTATTVITSSVTATTLVTSTQVSSVCSGRVSGGGDCGCKYDQFCNVKLVSSGGTRDVFPNVGGLRACIKRCDDNFYCMDVVYQKSTDTCTQIKVGSPTSTQVQDSDYISANTVNERCAGVCLQAYKRGFEAALEQGAVALRAAEDSSAGWKNPKKFIGATGGQ